MKKMKDKKATNQQQQQKNLKPWASWPKSWDLPLIRLPVEREQIRLTLVHLNFSVWLSPTSRGVDREQIPWTLPRWSQLSCQHVCNWSETRSLVTQVAACEPNGKPASFRGFGLFSGGLCLDWWEETERWKEREKEGFYSHNDGVLQFDFTVKLFSWHHCGGKKQHDRDLLQTLRCD